MYYTHTSLVHIQPIKQTTGNMMRRPGTSPAGASRHHSASLPNLLLSSSQQQQQEEEEEEENNMDEEKKESKTFVSQSGRDWYSS